MYWCKGKLGPATSSLCTSLTSLTCDICTCDLMWLHEMQSQYLRLHGHMLTVCGDQSLCLCAKRVQGSMTARNGVLGTACVVWVLDEFQPVQWLCATAYIGLTALLLLVSLHGLVFVGPSGSWLEFRHTGSTAQHTVYCHSLHRREFCHCRPLFVGWLRSCCVSVNIGCVHVQLTVRSQHVCSRAGCTVVCESVSAAPMTHQ